MEPKEGKVYWVRRIFGGHKFNPFRAKIVKITPKMIEYHTADFPWLPPDASVRTELEIVEETSWPVPFTTGGGNG